MFNENNKSKSFLLKVGCLFCLGIFFLAYESLAAVQNMEEGSGWIEQQPNTTDFNVGSWQFEIYPNHSINRTSAESKSGNYSIRVASQAGANGGPHVRYNGQKLDSFYQAFWVKVIQSSGSSTFGGSGNALKIMGSRSSSNENELMARDSLDRTGWVAYMSNNRGGANLYFPFNSRSSGDMRTLSFGEWHYIKIFQNNSGRFDMWIDNEHVPYVNTRLNGGGTWKSLPMSDYDVTARREIIWWNLNYSGAGCASNIVYYEDDLYYGAADPGYPSNSGGNSSPPNSGDDSPPIVTNKFPMENSKNFYQNEAISVQIQDSGDGVDRSSIVLRVNGQTVNPTISGDSSEYTIVYNPSTQFDLGQEVSVSISAQDLANPPNTMNESYVFHVNMLRVVSN